MRNVRVREQHAAAPAKHQNLRVVVYIGCLRPVGRPDCGYVLLESLHASRHSIAALILERGDVLAETAREWNIPVFTLPRELSRPYRMSMDAMTHDQAVREQVIRWVTKVQRTKPDIGLVYYGRWIPPEWFNAPPLGFLNYHPSPLPELKGMEPDTMAVLQGRTTMQGTVHQVTTQFDEGPIYRYTSRLRLTRHVTPKWIFEELSLKGVPTLIRVLNGIAAGRAKPVKQLPHGAADASRRRIRRESVIQWETDTVDMIDRRARAFLGQDIGIRLQAQDGATLRIVNRLEWHRGTFPGLPGQAIGTYGGGGPLKGCPVLRARDGVVVVQWGPAVHEGFPTPPAAWLMPTGRQPRTTRLKDIRRSLRKPQ